MGCIYVHDNYLVSTLDRDVLEGLERVGFRLNYGIDGSGFPLLAWERAGGYYFGKTFAIH